MTQATDSQTDATSSPSQSADDFVLTPPAVFPYKEQQITARTRITEQMASRILMLDGAMGTQIQ
ncbi:MAG: hypothetical protein ACTH5O_10555, partial [Psychrobacter sp.]